MIHYHGTPISGPHDEHLARFFRGRNALVSHAHRSQLPIVAENARTFVFDNGAYSAWKSGREMDVAGYVEWVREWHLHPGFSWALIPDVIGGTEKENDAMLGDWPVDLPGVPVWHMNETVERLEFLADGWRTVAIGSSALYRYYPQYAHVFTG